MSQELTKDDLKDKDWKKAKNELTEMLSRFGWKWAVLASTANRIINDGYNDSQDLISRLRNSKVLIESGCYSACDVASDLREIEKDIFNILLEQEVPQTDQFLDLIGKAINGTIRKGDVDFSGTKTVLADCLTLPCVCN